MFDLCVSIVQCIGYVTDELFKTETAFKILQTHCQAKPSQAPN